MRELVLVVPEELRDSLTERALAAGVAVEFYLIEELRSLTARSTAKVGVSPIRMIGRLADVKAMVRLSRITIDRLEKAGDFPQRIRLSKGAVGWDLLEVSRWAAARPRGIRKS